jgi:hypothetical protein
VILPHIGSASYKTRATMALMAADNLIAGVYFDNDKNLSSKIELLNIFLSPTTFILSHFLSFVLCSTIDYLVVI